MNRREELLKELKELTYQFINEGGNIQLSRKNFPSRVRSIISAIQSIDRKNGKYSDMESIFAEINIIRSNKKPDSVTDEVFLAKVNEHLANGGSIYDTDIPYKVTLRTYREKFNVTTKEAYARIGIAYDEHLNKRIHTNVELNTLLNDIKDENGNIDVLYESDKGQNLIRDMRYMASKYDMPFNNYLMFLYGVRTTKNYENVEYIEETKKLLEDYIEKHGEERLSRADMDELDPKLVTKIKYLANHFPEGRVTFGYVISFFGYKLLHRRQVDLFTKEDKLIKELNEAFPDRVIGKNFSQHPLYDRTLKYANAHDLTAKQYLELHDFEYEYGYDPFSVARISKMKMCMSDDSLFKEICKQREKLLEEKGFYTETNDMNKNHIMQEVLMELNRIYGNQIELKPY